MTLVDLLGSWGAPVMARLVSLRMLTFSFADRPNFFAAAMMNDE